MHYISDGSTSLLVGCPVHQLLCIHTYNIMPGRKIRHILNKSYYNVESIVGYTDSQSYTQPHCTTLYIHTFEIVYIETIQSPSVEDSDTPASINNKAGPSHKVRLQELKKIMVIEVLKYKSLNINQLLKVT